jgi:putative heme-binding domain-containing protein
MVAARYPTRQSHVDREILRLLAMNEAADLLASRPVLAEITSASDPIEDEHRLVFLARMPHGSMDDAISPLANAWLGLDRKFTSGKRARDRNWPLRMGEAYAAMARNVSGLNEALVAHVEFGRPDHVLFSQAGAFPRARAAEIFLARAGGQEDYAWSPALVELLGALPSGRAIAAARALWPNQAVRDAIVPILARMPSTEDRACFLEGLASPQLATIKHCLKALDRLPASGEPDNVYPLVRLLRSLGTGKEEAALKEQAGALLRRATGVDLPSGDANAWTDWLARTYPALAAKLTNADGVDRAAWDRRLASIDWTAGDGGRGQGVFRKAGCASCHSSTQALGPDLAGVTNRFGFGDLVTSIIQPSKDVSPRYQTTLLATADGKTHQGTIIYEATDGVLLQTGPTTMIRIAGNQVTSRRPAPLSLMPAGLLDQLSNAEIADLFAYLKTLKK